MRIMVLANYDVGLYQFRKELLEELLKENEVYISLPYGELVEPLKEIGCQFIDTAVDRRGINPLTDIKLLLAYFKLIKEIKPELVITYTIKPNVYGGMICRLLHIPYAINITGLGTAFERGGLLTKLVTVLYKIACQKAKVVFFENAANRDVFLEKKIISLEQVCLLNGAGVNLEKYPVIEYQEGDILKFLFMGRVMAEKGINELFEAMKRLVTEGVDAELHVLGGYEEDYKELIETYEREGWLHYHGYQKDVRPFIHDSHCFVLPSWHEGMANTNLECAASGRPIITSNIPGCREAVIDGVTGYLAKSKDANDLYLTMKKFAELSYEERRQMGQEGRKHMEVVFDKKIVINDTFRGLCR